jgi:hypothetical protein
MLKRLWQWLLGLFAKTDGDGFRPRERLIYRYFDGTRVVSADPLVLYQKVMDVAPSIAADAAAARTPGFSKGEQAYQSMLEAMRGIFGVTPFKDLGQGKYEGLTESEVTALYAHFWEYVEGVLPAEEGLPPEGGVKKNSPPSPTSPEATSVSPAPTSAGASATRSSSDCGSTGDGPSTGSPRPPDGA